MTINDKRNFLIFKISIIMVGVLLISYGLSLIYIETAKISSFADAVGTVVYINKYERDDDSISIDDAVRDPLFGWYSSGHRGSNSPPNLPRYKPAYEFSVNNQKYYICPKHSSYAYTPMGSRKIIKYNPLNPKDAVVPDFPPGNSTSSIVYGTLFVFVGVILKASIFLNDET